MGHTQLKILDKDDLEANVQAAKRGDQAGFVWLIAHTKTRLLRFLFFLTGDGPLAQDLSQETYLYVLENISQLKESSAFVSWLYLIAKNRFLDYRKSPRNQRYEDLVTLDKIGDFGQSSDKELWFQIRQALAPLKPEEQETLLLVDLEGYSYSEAAKMLEISEASLTSRLHRARQAFHKNFFGT
jgi:RNA polymerase sigma-70 factor, ECF subfamily